jgi:hypothetical protein
MVHSVAARRGATRVPQIHVGDRHALVVTVVLPAALQKPPPAPVW